LNVPEWAELDGATDLAKVYLGLGPEIFVKPTSGGGSLGAGIVRDVDSLRLWINKCSASPRSVIASSRIVGTDVTVGIVEVNGAPVVLPPLATTYRSEFYDYATKHDTALRTHHCPPDWLQNDGIATVCCHAKQIFRAVGCSGYGRVDFIVDGDGKCWFLEINTMPGLSRQGNLATMASAHGWTYLDLIKHILPSRAQAGAYRP